jgi:hypothetical protein
MGRRLVAMAGMVILAGSTASAHHAYQEFQRDRIVTVEGAITRLEYQNPHVVLTVKTSDSSIYTVVWSAPSNLLRRYGFESTTLKVGDRVVVSGSPHRDASLRTLSLITEVRRPADGKVWSEPRRDTQASAR